MIQCAAAEKDVSFTSPLEELSAVLGEDMCSVNTLILARMQSDVALIPQLAGYLIAAGGKRIRPLMTLASTRLFDDETSRPFRLAAAVEFIHTATLLHDDVVDESDQRRGQAAANRLFGNQPSVLVGDFLFSRAFELMVEDGSIEVLGILSRAASVITEGEVLQLSIQNRLETTLDQYLSVIAAKTAALFAAACEIGPVIAGESPEMREALRGYGHNLGMAFQIADDVLDYQANPDELGKSLGDDFREGKLTAPVLFALAEADRTEKLFWERTFQNRDVNESDLFKAQSIISHHRADQAAFDLARSYVEKAIKSLDLVPHGKIKSLLVELAGFALTRSS